MTHTIRVLLDWFPNTVHSGFLLADRRGYYADVNITLDLHGDVHGVMETADADFVVGPQASMLVEMAREQSLLGVATLTHQQDSALISLKSAQINRPRDLEGKRLTHWAPEWFHVFMSELMARDGGAYDKVKRVPMDVGDPETVLGTQADAIWIYTYWEYFLMRSLGHDVHVIQLRDYGVPFNYPSPGMAVNRQLWETDPDLVRHFLNATAKGYEDAAREGSAVLPEIQSALPNVDPSMLAESLDYIAPLLLDSSSRWGRLDPTIWRACETFMYDKGLLGDTPLDLSYVNAFDE